VGFILKPDHSTPGPLLEELVGWVRQRGDQSVVIAEDQVAPDGAVIVPEDAFAREIDIAVVLGGDGTMLRAAQLVADARIPVLGINLGRVGFLTPFAPTEATEAIDAALAGKLSTEERMRLQVNYQPAQGTSVTRSALNDAVVHQGAMARLIEVDARVDDELVCSYRADGLIVATPTGSTAYNLAAGGPILAPGQAAMAVTPICAHALTNRTLVLPPGVTLTLSLRGESRGAVITIDGQWAHTFLPQDLLIVTTRVRPLVIFRSDKSYFDILRDKLHWGAPPGGAPPGGAPPGGAPPGGAPPGGAPPGGAPPGGAPPGGAAPPASAPAGSALPGSAPAAGPAPGGAPAARPARRAAYPGGAPRAAVAERHASTGEATALPDRPSGGTHAGGPPSGEDQDTGESQHAGPRHEGAPNSGPHQRSSAGA
jgi:NAD+ kinase